MPTEHIAQVVKEDNPIMSLLRPPIHRAATATLDRALFKKTFPVIAARVADNRTISKYRVELTKSNEILTIPRFISIHNDPDPALASKGSKCILLQPEVKADDPSTWSAILKQAVAAKDLGLIPYNLTLDYNYWSYHEIMESILPEDVLDEIPVGFTIVGHVAHLNLREEYLPYKYLTAQVLLDKNASIKTVINKIENVGVESEFRTFGYEVLAGPDDMEVEVSEEDCTFRFDYSKVYWNSRLNTEHSRLVSMFNAGDVVVDVMAGVGPFAVPAGKKRVFVWANDLNPASYESMRDAVKRNKVEKFVRPFNENGHTFIHHAVADVLELTKSGSNTVQLQPKRGRNVDPKTPHPEPITLTIPQTVSHFIMNLPASAIDFLPSFNGLYAGHEDLFSPNTKTQLPMVHVHCFSTKSDDNIREGIEICQRITEKLGVEIKPGDDDVTIHDVRDVAPEKRMFCASFRLPPAVAFRKPKE